MENGTKEMNETKETKETVDREKELMQRLGENSAFNIQDLTSVKSFTRKCIRNKWMTEEQGQVLQELVQPGVRVSKSIQRIYPDECNETAVRSSFAPVMFAVTKHLFQHEANAEMEKEKPARKKRSPNRSKDQVLEDAEQKQIVRDARMTLGFPKRGQLTPENKEKLAEFISKKS